MKINSQLARHRLLGAVAIRECIYQDGSLLGYKFIKVNPKTGKTIGNEIETVDLGIITVRDSKALSRQLGK